MKKGRNEGPSAGQCFCYICQLIGRSWERLCGEQTWPTMRELKEAKKRLFSFCSPWHRVRELYFCFRNDFRAVTSCPDTFEITSIHHRRRALSGHAFVRRLVTIIRLRVACSARETFVKREY